VNLTLPEAGAPGSLVANVVLAVHHGNRRIAAEDLPSPPSPRVTNVSTTTQAGVYGAGQAIDITVSFDAEVVVHCMDRGLGTNALACPALALQTRHLDRAAKHAAWPVSRLHAPVPAAAASTDHAHWFDPLTMTLATFAGGNGTAQLTFLYVVRPGDAAASLDYADTRPAARTQRFSRALVLPCDLAGSDCHRVGPGDGQAALLLRALDPSTGRPPDPAVHVVGFLPLPGSRASLAPFNVSIDTAPPAVLAVTTPLRDGVYQPAEGLLTAELFPLWNAGVAVPGSFPRPGQAPGTGRESSTHVKGEVAVDVHFSAPVAAALMPAGCALELLMLVAVHRSLGGSDGFGGSNGALRQSVGGRRVAEWRGDGNGTATLRFWLPLVPGDYSPRLDYSPRPDALGVVCAAPSDAAPAALYRAALPSLVVPANLTLARPGPRVSKVSVPSTGFQRWVSDDGLSKGGFRITRFPKVGFG
jgi:hypothetical protein